MPRERKTTTYFCIFFSHFKEACSIFHSALLRASTVAETMECRQQRELVKKAKKKKKKTRTMQSWEMSMQTTAGMLCKGLQALWCCSGILRRMSVNTAGVLLHSSNWEMFDKVVTVISCLCVLFGFRKSKQGVISSPILRTRVIPILRSYFFFIQDSSVATSHIDYH